MLAQNNIWKLLSPNNSYFWRIYLINCFRPFWNNRYVVLTINMPSLILKFESLMHILKVEIIIFWFIGRFDPPQIRWKSDQAIKKSKSDFVAECPIWVSIKRYLTGKLALAYQNWIYCIRFVEKVQKPFKTECFRIQLFYEVFGRCLLNGCSKSNSDKLAPTYPSNTSW